MYIDTFKLTHGSRELQNGHIMACLKFLSREFRTAGVVMIVENLPSSRGSEIGYQVAHIESVVMMCEFGSDNRPGVPKTRATTQKMTAEMRELLVTDSIHFAKNMGTYPQEDMRLQPEAVEKQQVLLCNELTAFQVDDQGRISGKAAGPDDAAVAVMTVILWAPHFLKSPAYQKWRSEH